MIYPTAKTKKEFDAKWYNAQEFGTKTSYGYHEADDINLKTGGDTDLGQPLYAIADGEITSVCTTHPTKNFGLHLHLKFEVKEGTRWAHYAHCKAILVKEGDKVKEGEKIAELGKSGTTAAHLHFAIKNAATGIEGIAKTKEDLKKWENPIPFIEEHLNGDCVDEKEFNLLQEKYDALRKLYKECDTDKDLAREEVKRLEKRVKTLEGDYENLTVSHQLNLTTLEAQIKLNGVLSQKLLDCEKQVTILKSLQNIYNKILIIFRLKK